MRRSKVLLVSMLSILFYSLMFMKPSAEIDFNIEESIVCNIYYKIPKELRSTQRFLLKNSKGEVVAVLEVDGDTDAIFFENVPFGEYYIEAVGCGFVGNCFPIVLGTSSLYGAHIKKDLNVEYNFFTEEQSKVIIDLGYSGTEVTEDVLKEVGKILGSTSSRYPNHYYPEAGRPSRPSKPSNSSNNDSNVSYNYDNYANKDNYEKNENSENGYLDNSQNLDNSNNSSKPNDVNNSNDGSDVGSSNDVGNPSKPGNHLLIPHSIIPALIVIAVLLLLLIPLGLFILFHRKKEDKDEEVS